MIVEIDPNSGFCFGVVRAIERAERELKNGELCSLGDIVHNRIEVNRLQEQGLKIVTHADLAQLAGQRVYIRAHGEPPTTFERCKEMGIELIDATCPVVSKLQQTVRNAYEIMEPVGGQVVIVGKKGHPEVTGLNGQIDNEGIVIEGLNDLILVDFNRPIYLLSQTTKPLELFKEISDEVTKKFRLDNKYLTIKDSICRNVSNREGELAKFVINYDLILFVSGKDSSNGMALYEFCKKHNHNCYKIEDERDVLPSWLEGVARVGICGATSTPKWLMEQVRDALM